MHDLPSRLLQEHPEKIANRLMQKAHNRDGLPEIAVGLCFLETAFTMWLQVAFQYGSLPYRLDPLGLMVGVPVLGLGSPWAIRKVRRRFLIEKEGYVKFKPVHRKQSAIVAAVAVVTAVLAVIVAYKGAFPPSSYILAGTGIGGGLLAALSGRLPRYVIGGVVMALTGILLALSRVSLGVGYTILYGFMGLLSLVSGCVVLLLFLRQPVESGE